jgi:uncharacterized phage protein gp47/JayE
MATLAATIDSTGISAPDYADIYAQMQSLFWQIYGSDADLSPDTQDGQFIAIFAQAVYDANQVAIAVYNSFSPTFAQGAGLSSVVKINGIRRDVATASTAPITIAGTPSTPIVGALVGDDLGLGTQWSVPNCTIGGGGLVSVTATCTELGATAAASGTLTRILTPTFGWQSVTSTADATLGAPVEEDGTLRQRQAKSTSLPAQTPLEAIYANVANVVGVEPLQIYENDTDITDANGVPPHSIAVVAGGTGDPVAICTAIADKKSPGTGTYGTTTEVIVDQNGVPDTINYFILSLVPVTVNITIQSLTGWVTATEALIQQSVAAFLTGLGVGTVDYLARLYAPANLSGDAATGATGMTQAQLDILAQTYTVTSLTQSRPSNAPPAVQDVPIAFNEAASGSVANVNITVL